MSAHQARAALQRAPAVAADRPHQFRPERPSSRTGKDATEDFEYYGHSDKAREQMAAFLVGDYEVRHTPPPALPLASRCLFERIPSMAALARPSYC